jgi:hypothetical protein
MSHVLSHPKLDSKKRDEYMAKNNYVESNKITIASWVGKALGQSLI